MKTVLLVVTAAVLTAQTRVSTPLTVLPKPSLLSGGEIIVQDASRATSVDIVATAITVGPSNSNSVVGIGTFTQHDSTGATKVSISSGGSSAGGIATTLDTSSNPVNRLDENGGQFKFVTTQKFTGSASYVELGAGVVNVKDSSGNIKVLLSSGGAGFGVLKNLDAAGNVGITIDGSGATPGADNTFSLGTPAARWSDIDTALIHVRSAASGTRRWQISGATLQGIDGGGNITFSVDDLTGTITAASLAGAGTQCLQADNSGVVSVTGAGCAGAVFSGAWSSYTPSTTHLSSTSTTAASITNSKSTFVRLQVTGTSDGSNPALGLPATPASSAQTLACTITTSGATVNCVAVFSSSTVVINLYNNTALSNGTVYTITVQGVYETT